MSSAWIKKWSCQDVYLLSTGWIISRCWVAWWEGTCHEFYSNRKPRRNICVGLYLKSTRLERDERVPDRSVLLRFWSSSENLFVGYVRLQLEIWIIRNQTSRAFFLVTRWAWSHRVNKTSWNSDSHLLLSQRSCS